MLSLPSLFVALLILTPLSTCYGFVISQQPFHSVSNGNAAVVSKSANHGAPRNSFCLQLHPDQAAELEACAYDLMRQATSSSSSASVASGRPQGNVMISMVKQSKSRTGHHDNSVISRPVAWCRRLMASAFHQEYSRNQAKP